MYFMDYLVEYFRNVKANNYSIVTKANSNGMINQDFDYLTIAMTHDKINLPHLFMPIYSAKIQNSICHLICYEFIKLNINFWNRGRVKQEGKEDGRYFKLF